MTSNIAAAINVAHAAVERAKQEAVTHAIECGRLLTSAKATVAHGQWAAWLEANCPFSMRTAQLYMKAAAYVGNDASKAQRVADLNLRDLGRFLAERSSGEKLRDMGIADADEFSEEDQSALTEMLTIWGKSKPAWRKKWLKRLHELADEQGVPANQIVFPS